MKATLTSKGQVTIPKAIRDRFSLHAGSRISFVALENHVEIIPETMSLKDLQGILPKPTKKLTLLEIEKIIAKGAAK